MTIAEVLVEAGWPLGKRGRCRCPLHRGDNDQAFSFRETTWHCFRCDIGGGVNELRRRLGLLPPPRPRPQMRGVDPLVFARVVGPPRDTRPPPSRRLAALLEAWRVARLNVWDALHQRAVRQLAAAELVLAAGPDDEAFDVAAALAVEALGWRDQADAQLGCDCRRLNPE